MKTNRVHSQKKHAYRAWRLKWRWATWSSRCVVNIETRTGKGARNHWVQNFLLDLAAWNAALTDCEAMEADVRKQLMLCQATRCLAIVVCWTDTMTYMASSSNGPALAGWCRRRTGRVERLRRHDRMHRKILRAKTRAQMSRSKERHENGRTNDGGDEAMTDS